MTSDQTAEALLSIMKMRVQSLTLIFRKFPSKPCPQGPGLSQILPQDKQPLQPVWTRPHPVLLTVPMAVRLDALTPWTHLSHVKAAAPQPLKVDEELLTNTSYSCEPLEALHLLRKSGASPNPQPRECHLLG